MTAGSLVADVRTAWQAPDRLGARARDLIGLTWVLSRKNFRVRFKRAALGVFWAVIQPAFQALVLSYVFMRVFHVTRLPHYPLYVLSGILPWAFFSGSLSAGTVSVVDNGSLVKKVALPLVVFPLSAVGGTAIAFVAAMPVLVVGAAVSGTLSFSLFVLPLAVVLEIITICGVVLLTSSLYPAFRDLRYLVESLLLIGLYLTPILYDRSQLHSTAANALLVNPMTGVLETYRTAVYGRAMDWTAIGCTLAVDTVVLALSITVFRRRSDEFPDLV